MRKTGLILAVGALFLVAGNPAFSWDKQMPGKMPKMDLKKSCAKECPNAQTNEDVMKCIDSMEQAQGETMVKKQHRACFNAHEKYEKMTGKQEAGEVGESESESSSSSSESETQSSY